MQFSLCVLNGNDDLGLSYWFSEIVDNRLHGKDIMEADVIHVSVLFVLSVSFILKAKL